MTKMERRIIVSLFASWWFLSEQPLEEFSFFRLVASAIIIFACFVSIMTLFGGLCDSVVEDAREAKREAKRQERAAKRAVQELEGMGFTWGEIDED